MTNYERKPNENSPLGVLEGRPCFASEASDLTKWSGPGSNRQPLACKASALPIELPPQEGFALHFCPTLPYKTGQSWGMVGGKRRRRVARVYALTAARETSDDPVPSSPITSEARP